MVCSHLTRLGITANKFESTSDDNIALNNANLVVTDHKTWHQIHPIIEKTNPDIKGLILLPLTNSLMLPDRPGWTSITLPVTSNALKAALNEIDEEHPLSFEIPDSDQEKSAVTAKVLIAEDVEINQKIATEMLSLLGCDVIIAEDGLQAVSLFKSYKFDLIFMDCQMPVMDGFEAARNIRALEEESGAKKTPIIALTAGVSPEDKARCNQAGMTGYLPKPFTISDLSGVLRRHRPDTKKVEFKIITSKEGIDNVESKEIINAAPINNIREVEHQTGRPLLSNILDGFSNQMPQKLAELSAAIRNSDYEGTYKAAHAIKSMSANIGAEKVRHICAKIELDGKAQKKGISNTSLIELEAAYEEFLQEFTRCYLLEKEA
jgi:CheY-like chemotaxis protein